MKLRTKHVLAWLVAAAFSTFSVAALAMPKAAEHEDAPVTMGPNVAKPTPSATTANPAKQAPRKAAPAAKGKPVKVARGSRTPRRLSKN